jgi:hypothetical protein
MQPIRTTEAPLEDILQQMRSREPIFHRSELGTTRADFERMTAPDFWEVGASGRVYSREYVLDELEKRHQQPVVDDLHAEDFRCRQLAPDVYLVTYTLTQQKTRKTRRSTIWQKTTDGWSILFHQGTVVAEE